ncbi:hypothetical protein MDA_GLEAN10017967 [Myotis davidii]|uniref:Uncharacterized protein n=1 Tax=Myotis davidii TaxID=225400 RepID=L5LDX1_MYODS|nr:hypothetical protein MDA_GLEAN10017967 [Myotis davidii]
MWYSGLRAQGHLSTGHFPKNLAVQGGPCHLHPVQQPCKGTSSLTIRSTCTDPPCAPTAREAALPHGTDRQPRPAPAQHSLRGLSPGFRPGFLVLICGLESVAQMSLIRHS